MISQEWLNDSMKAVPLFHLLMRMGQHDEAIEQARLTLVSLEKQIYPYWKLHLLARYDDSTFDEVVKGLIESRDSGERRRQSLYHWLDIKDAFFHKLTSGFKHLDGHVLFAPRGISLADLAGPPSPDLRPNFVVVLSIGDQLSGDALTEMTIAVNSFPQFDFFYCNEERINRSKDMIEPILKPGWSPSLLLSTNYIGRLWWARTDLLARIGVGIEAFVRNGEYDLVLRCTERASGIAHVPTILCRRLNHILERCELEKRALTRALARRGIEGKVRCCASPGVYHIA